MSVFPTRTLRFRRILRAIALFVGLFAVIGIAMFGAVLAFAVLAIGTLVHFALRALRGNGPRPAATVRRSSSRVIDGEYTIVERRSSTRVITAPQG